MPYISGASRRRIALFFTAFVLIALVNYFSPWLLPYQNLASVFYSLLLLAWMVSVFRRILQLRVRRCFVLGAGLLLLMFLVRLVRFNLPPSLPVLSRYLWFAYYLPMTAVPMEALAAALFFGREEGAAPPKYFRLFPALWALLSALILANDLHGWMFRIPEGSAGHSYGPLYYVTFGWIALLSLGSFGVLMRRCRLSQCRRLWYVPVLAAIPGFVLLMWYFAMGGNSPQLFGHKLFHLQEAYAVLFIFVWESCIQIGLILTNTDYGKIFSLLPLNAFLTDRSGRVFSRSAGMALPPPEKRAEAGETPVPLDGDHLLYRHAIRDGAVFWIEDISAVNDINRRLAAAIEYLEDEQSLLEEEASIRAQRAAYETQNRLYDAISPLVQPQLAAAQRLLAEGAEDTAAFPERLTLAMVLCVYAKRRVNLALLASKNERLSVGELELAIRETLEYLRLRGVVCSLERLGTGGDLTAEELLLAYDFFASVVEAALPGLSALLALVRTGETFGMELSMQSPANLPAEHWRLRQREKTGAVMSFLEEDGITYARLRFPGEAVT